MKKLVIDGATRKISKDKIVVGYLQENRTEKIEFEIPQEYQNYGRKACFEAEGNTFSKTFDNITGNTLTLTRDITKFEKIKMSIEFFKIENEDEIIARTSILNLIIENSVICDDDVKPDDPKVTILDELIVEVGKTINETNNLDIDIQDSVVTITKKDGTTKSENVKGETGETGSKGEDAKINGVNSIVLEAGDNIEIEQDGQKTIIKSTASGNVEDVYVDGTSVLDENKIAQIDLSGKADKTEIPTKTSDLTNDSNFAKTNSNNNFNAAQTINGTLTVNGDIVQNGESYETHAEQLFTKNDLIKTRDGAIGGLADNELTGIEAINYDGANNGRLAFDSKGVARVGDVGDEQPLLTRDEEANLTTGQVLVWDGTNLRAIGSSNYVKNTDYATSIKGGIVKVPNRGIAIKNGDLETMKATNEQIDQKIENYTVIVPSNLDYAVRSVLPLATDTVPSTLVANTEYYLGETASLSFAFPTTGEKGQYCFVKFDSGTTATALTVTGTNYVGDIPTPEASKSYEILATWNGAEWVATYRAY